MTASIQGCGGYRSTESSSYPLFAFAAGVVRIYSKLSEKGKKRIRGMLLDGLKPDNNLMSLQHEVSTADTW